VKRVLEERENDHDDYSHDKRAKRMRGSEQEEEEKHEEAAAAAKDDSLTLFMDLLREKRVSAFSTWEKELPRIADDPRYTGFTLESFALPKKKQ